MYAILTVVLLVVWDEGPTPPQTTHYLGEVKLSGPDGRPYGSQVILLAKTVHFDDRKMGLGRITERAVLVKPDGSAEDHTVTLTVKGNTFTAADGKTVEGGGALSGPAWKWTYLKGTFTHKNGATVEDENFMADPSVLTARKTVTGKDGKVLVRMDMSLKAVTPATFDVLAAGVLKK